MQLKAKQQSPAKPRNVGLVPDKQKELCKLCHY